MKASEELLNLRRSVVAGTCPDEVTDRLQCGVKMGGVSWPAYDFLCRQTGKSVMRWHHGRTHLEVVEMIERAAVAAKEAEE